MGAAVMQVVSKQQLRTQETQARLLNAAEEVFVRDGYGAAQLDEIAARADRSKGAVYTHFKSKEDLFLALFEHRMKEYIGRLTASLERAANRKQSLEVFRDFYVGLVQDQTWSLLTLEFKLYALRHPESKERLRKAFEMSKATTGNQGYEQMFGRLTREQRADNDLALAALGPIFSGLMLESHFETEILSQKGLRKILGGSSMPCFPPIDRPAFPGLVSSRSLVPSFPRSLVPCSLLFLFFHRSLGISQDLLRYWLGDDVVMIHLHAVAAFSLRHGR